MNQDPHYFKDPRTFNPERFLVTNEDGSYRFKKNERVLFFGTGRFAFSKFYCYIGILGSRISFLY